MKPEDLMSKKSSLRLPVAKTEGRTCGACTLCCTTHNVPELGKSAGVRCQHLTSSGCGIYDDRPQSCRDFECVWLQGYMTDGARPDRSRAVVGASNSIGVQIHVEPTRLDRWDRSAPIRRLAKNVLAQGRAVVVMGGDGQKRRVVCNDPKLVQHIINTMGKGVGPDA